MPTGAYGSRISSDPTDVIAILAQLHSTEKPLPIAGALPTDYRPLPQFCHPAVCKPALSLVEWEGSLGLARPVILHFNQHNL